MAITLKDAVIVVPQEHRTPAENLDAFNQNIVGPIEVVAEFRGRSK